MNTTALLFTFIDDESGELADIVAPNEAAARLWLGGEWILPDRCPLFAPPAAVGDWDRVVKDAQAEASQAFADMNAARPKRGTMASMEEVKAFNEATATYELKKARVTKLVGMSVAAS
ncbi:MAG: hypothetical protein K2Z80_12700 [Xanthobacteraceae bacterium]|nr:hypothetical protein [Xanthobacteraceae bacterium]